MIILKFITTFTTNDGQVIEKSHIAIAINYRDNGNLMMDIITWLPIVFFVDCSKNLFFRYFYLIKVLRFKKIIEKI